MASVGDSAQGQHTAGATFWKTLLLGQLLPGTGVGEDERGSTLSPCGWDRGMWRGFREAGARRGGREGGVASSPVFY